MRRAIHRCAELHLRHIADSGDPFESGAVRPLDFGHWAGHKLEQLSDYRIRHGEAVAIGIALDVIYSVKAGHLGDAAAERALRLLEELGFDLFADELLHASPAKRPRVLDGLEEFREHLGGDLTVTLLTEIGRGFEVHHMDAQKIIDSIDDLKRRHEEQGRQILRAAV